jgi:hypothetical protein
MVLPLQPFLGVKTVSTPDANLFFFAMLSRLFRRYRSETIPLALYELTEGRGRPCYRYLGTQAIREQQLRHGALNAVIQSLKHINL